MMAETFSPASAGVRPADVDSFRLAWRGLGASVVVIASELKGRRCAMLATAVTSVSMEPPSLLVCVNRNASAYPIIRDRGAFSLGILGASAHALGQYLANASAEARFERGDWRVLSDDGGAIAGLPWLAEAQASVFCRTDRCVDYGSHTVFIGLVEGVAAEDACDPLLYCDGRYRRLGHVLP